MPNDDRKKEALESAIDYRVYSKKELDQELRQAEIISDLIQHRYDSELDEVKAEFHRYVIVVTQDCDLLQDYKDQLNNVLLYKAEPASDVRTMVPPGSDIWKRIIQNKDERYHLLEAIGTEDDCVGKGVPALIIDFRRFFTLPAVEVYRQFARLDGAKRRCRLEMPYREHFQVRLAFYFQRVMIPEPHKHEKLTKALPGPKAG